MQLTFPNTTWITLQSKSRHEINGCLRELVMIPEEAHGNCVVLIVEAIIIHVGHFCSDWKYVTCKTVLPILYCTWPYLIWESGSQLQQYKRFLTVYCWKNKTVLYAHQLRGIANSILIRSLYRFVWVLCQSSWRGIWLDAHPNEPWIFFSTFYVGVIWVDLGHNLGSLPKLCQVQYDCWLCEVSYLCMHPLHASGEETNGLSWSLWIWN